MARLSVWYDSPPLGLVSRVDHPHLVTAHLAIAGIRFAQLFRATRKDLAADPRLLLRSRAPALASVLSQGPYQGWPHDLVVDEDPSEASEARLDEHTHASDEVRIWLRGTACLSIHHGGRILQVDCGPGDVTIVPAGLRHWLRPTGRGPHACVTLRPDEEAVMPRPSGAPTAAAYPPHAVPDAQLSDCAVGAS